MPSDSPVFVTGGSGVVGRAVVRRLLSDGRRVRALARSDKSARILGDLGAEPVRGDVLDPESLQNGLRGCAAAYHAAGRNQFCLRDPSAMYEVNVTGSVNVVRAAAEAGVERLVYTSSAVTLGEAAGDVGREETSHRGTFLSAYEHSKVDAERLVLDVASDLDLQVVCMNPSSVQGPGRASGTGQVLVRYLEGRLKVWVDTTISLVDIDDCAEGHVLAEAKGRAGERYVLNGTSLATRDLLRLMAEVAPGARGPVLVPRSMAVAAATLTEVAGRVRGRTPLVCRESLQTLVHGHRYDGSRAERELGLQYRPVEDTLRRTAAWLREQGLVSPRPLAEKNKNPTPR